MAKKQCTDHKGNVFNSLTEMCVYYGISLSVFRSRLKLGWTLRDILETPVADIKRGGKCRDHNGREFENVYEMCKYWGIPYDRFRSRLLVLKWSLKDALEREKQKEVRSRLCEDHKGNKFESLTAMCRHYNLDRCTFSERLKAGWSLEDALEIPSGAIMGSGKVCIDHCGNKFKSVTAMCEYWQISYDILRYRLHKGWSLKDALETHVPSKGCKDHKSKGCKDHKGNEFSSQSDMCKYWGVSLTAFKNRIHKGWSLKDALEIHSVNECKKCRDFLGNEFKSINEMCRYYGVSRPTFDTRIRKGWSLKDALEIPVKKK